MDASDPIAPDTKDWTWVLDRACAECGVTAGDLQPDDFPVLILENARAWAARLDSPASGRDLAGRVKAGSWSVLEYACHVRDVHRIFDERLQLILGSEEPTFANWDQDEAARAGGYGEQDVATVRTELLEAAERVAASYESVPDDAWQRRGLRSDGSAFTTTTLGRYHLHDVVHHLHDVDRLLAYRRES